MRIQWSSEAAQEMLIRLERARQSMEACIRQTAQVQSAMEDANPDGDDQAMIKARERFEACSEDMKAFRQKMDDFERALLKADELFSEAESDLLRNADNIQAGNSRTIAIGRNTVYVNWEPSAFAVMPSMRVNTVRMPEWFEAVLATVHAAQFGNNSWKRNG